VQRKLPTYTKIRLAIKPVGSKSVDCTIYAETQQTGPAAGVPMAGYTSAEDAILKLAGNMAEFADQDLTLDPVMLEVSINEIPLRDEDIHKKLRDMYTGTPRAGAVNTILNFYFNMHDFDRLTEDFTPPASTRRNHIEKPEPPRTTQMEAF
jgi:hypothetical protein